MGLRFSRRIKIMPGLRLNLGMNGVSVSAGVRGASLTYGKNGLYGNVGLVGTGISHRAKIGGSSVSRTSNQDIILGVKLVLQDDGILDILLSDGSRPPPKIISQIRKNGEDKILGFLEKNCSLKNDQVNKIATIHFQTPSPNPHISYYIQEFDELPPSIPIKKQCGFWAKIFKSQRIKIDNYNLFEQEKYDADLVAWGRKKDLHNLEQMTISRLYSLDRVANVKGMEDCLDHRLQSIDWILPTEISYEFSNDLSKAFIDVDLPEVENMPCELATVLQRPLGLKYKKVSESIIRKNYLQYIHGIIFRMVGECFATLPTVQEIIISGYSQRVDKSTGEVTDEYLISSIIDKNDWNLINFDNLYDVDPVDALGKFNTRRNYTKSGIFKAIIPFDLRYE